MQGQIKSPGDTSPDVGDDLAASLNKDGQTNAAAVIAALEGPPERLHVRDAASITTRAGVEADHVG